MNVLQTDSRMMPSHRGFFRVLWLKICLVGRYKSTGRISPLQSTGSDPDGLLYLIKLLNLQKNFHRIIYRKIFHHYLYLVTSKYAFFHF